MAAAAAVLLALTAAAAGADGTAGPRLAVEPGSFDFGKVRPEKTLYKELALRNFGDAELVIEKVSTTCDCTVVGGYARRVAPGKGTSLRVGFTTPATPGRAVQTVTVISNDPTRPKVEVTLGATVVAGARRAPRAARPPG